MKAYAVLPSPINLIGHSTYVLAAFTPQISTNSIEAVKLQWSADPSEVSLYSTAGCSVRPARGTGGFRHPGHAVVRAGSG